ncbi:TetR/AcrR family transcriptional regulator [Halovulum sp. GXIMD14794]
MDQISPEADKRERILQATAELIVTGGLETPMSRIASHSGVAIGTIYSHFPSKTDIVIGVYARLADQLRTALVPEAEESGDEEDRVEAYLHRYIDFFWSDPERAMLFEYLSNVPLIPPADIADVFQPVRDYNRAIFSEAHAAGQLRTISPRTMAAFVGGAIRNALKWRRVHGEPLTETDRADLVAMCLNATGSARLPPARQPFQCTPQSE